ncbi:NAD-dependent epimerase/dehydratase family protein [Jannaschia aquimarina]|uniref:StrE protein n=1 Tax=Jannaschia aquimarina TaxID=935700 RepID=A0A0D1CK64_9RHOB|nr:NAD-dependent epimerase/dehydratase family protein [Jannaschia aquimarina]KIT15137.1 dTDP-glucose 4,6-dehydratase [Jannaschia aquimarina]SNS65090.1 UDP-glucuronate 4-epimerase [Jannaschia aquimarina]
MRSVLITGTAGFIGFHLARRLLADGWQVTGFDGMTDYYDVALKRRRHQVLLQSPGFRAVEGMLEDMDLLRRTADDAAPDIIVHLAAQAGVRYSLENPRAYVSSNLDGTFNVLEVARMREVEHLLMASTSSAYGANTEMPFTEDQKADHPLTFYAATKRANEHMAHAYAHLWKMPVTLFRFFTVYGPWGRPDMALFKFVDAALNGRAIDLYNHGRMARDFTYVDDLVRAIVLLIDLPPAQVDVRGEVVQGDTLSPVAPHRIVNIGNGRSVQLLDFVDALERELGVEIRRNLMDMQPGDVPATWASSDLLERLTGYRPGTDLEDGIAQFVAWYRAYYDLPAD